MHVICHGDGPVQNAIVRVDGIADVKLPVHSSGSVRVSNECADAMMNQREVGVRVCCMCDTQVCAITAPLQLKGAAHDTAVNVHSALDIVQLDSRRHAWATQAIAPTHTCMC